MVLQGTGTNRVVMSGDKEGAFECLIVFPIDKDDLSLGLYEPVQHGFVAQSSVDCGDGEASHHGSLGGRQ